MQRRRLLKLHLLAGPVALGRDPRQHRLAMRLKKRLDPPSLRGILLSRTAQVAGRHALLHLAIGTTRVRRRHLKILIATPQLEQIKHRIAVALRCGARRKRPESLVQTLLAQAIRRVNPRVRRPHRQPQKERRMQPQSAPSLHRAKTSRSRVIQHQQRLKLRPRHRILNRLDAIAQIQPLRLLLRRVQQPGHFPPHIRRARQIRLGLRIFPPKRKHTRQSRHQTQNLRCPPCLKPQPLAELKPRSHN